MALDSIDNPFKSFSCDNESCDQQGASCSFPGGVSACTLNNEKLLLNSGGASLKEIIARVTAQVERLVLLQTLQHAKGNKALAARMLKIDYKTMHSKLKLYEISSSQFMRNYILPDGEPCPAIATTGEEHA